MATITVFVGSEREGRHGDKVGAWIGRALEARGHTVHLLDPREHHELAHVSVPFHYSKSPSSEMKQVHDWLAASDGFILVSPEYNHSYSGVLKNMVDNFMPEYEKKPFGIATYSAGPFGGIRANEHLRVVTSELKGVPTPIPFMVSGVGEVFDEKGELADKSYEGRLAKFLDDFEWYVQALQGARK